VVQRDGRIVAAACFLPLSENSSISRELGTRHRAAIGISEQSDAIVVVVSEETGTVSVTRNGEIYRYLRRDDVVDMLQSAIAQHHNITLKQFVREKIEEYRNGRNNAKEGKLPVKRGDRHDK
jgi:diadenylate cyclase